MQEIIDAQGFRTELGDLTFDVKAVSDSFIAANDFLQVTIAQVTKAEEIIPAIRRSSTRHRQIEETEVSRPETWSKARKS